MRSAFLASIPLVVLSACPYEPVAPPGDEGSLMGAWRADVADPQCADESDTDEVR